MELKNILSVPKQNCLSHKIGLEAELCVLNDLKSRGYNLWYQRLETPFAEVDLVFESPKGGLGIVEVKSLGPNSWMEGRISKRQIQRLTRAAEFLSIKSNKPVSLCVAFVSAGKIQYLPIE